MSKDKKQSMYFNIENFVQMVLQATKMDKASPAMIDQLSLEISQTLSDRVTATVVASLGDKELELLERIMEDHPELDRIDALSIITPTVPGLNERILKEVNDLYEELIDSVKMIEKSLSKQQSK